MNRLADYLDHPVVRYVVIAGVSLSAATILFLVGGSAAEVTNSKILGITFKAGGAFAGFIIAFILSQRFLTEAEAAKGNARFHTRLHVLRQPVNFSRRDGNFRCTGLIYNQDSNEERKSRLTPRWEAGLLTLDFIDVNANELIAAEISIGDKMWHIDYFSPTHNMKEVKDL